MGNTDSKNKNKTYIVVQRPIQYRIETKCTDCKQIPAYIISLNEELYQVVKGRLQNIGLENINRFNAIRGDSLNKFVEDRNNLTIKGLYNIKSQKYRGAHSELTDINAIGCYMSHVTLWKKIIDDKIPGLMIFESDCMCTGDILECLGDFLKVKNGHILYFGFFGQTVKYSDKNITQIYDKTYGLHAYYITKKGAEILLKNAFPIEQQIDSYMSDSLILSHELNSIIEPMNVYVCRNLCFQDGINPTTIQSKIVL